MENSEQKKNSKKTRMIVVVTFITFAIIGVIFFIAFKYKRQIVVEQDNNIVVAKVNDSKITKKEFSLAMSGIVSEIDLNKIDTSRTNIQEDIMVETLNSMIDKEVVVQKAKEMNLTVSSNEIDNELIKIKSNYGSYENYQATLNKLGISEEELRHDIEKQLLLSQYETRVINPANDNVTDDEIKTFYKNLSDKYIAQGSIAPDLELVRGMIVKKIIEIKHDLILQDEAKKLRKDAKIEVYI